MKGLFPWCKDNILDLNLSKTQEVMLDFRRETEEPLWTPEDKGDPYLEGVQLQVPEGSYFRGFLMHYIHLHPGDESKAALGGWGHTRTGNYSGQDVEALHGLIQSGEGVIVALLDRII